MTVRVKEFRRALGLSQQALADAVGTSQQQIQRIEAGKATAKLDLAVRIAEALDQPLPILFPAASEALGELASCIEQSHSVPEDVLVRLGNAGLDGEVGFWTIVLYLRGHEDPIELPVDTQALDSVWSSLLGPETADLSMTDFAVFDGGNWRFAVNLRDLVCHQFLFHTRSRQLALYEFPQKEFLAYVSGRVNPIQVDVPVDPRPDESGDVGQLAHMFEMTYLDLPADYRFPIRDIDGGYLFLRAGDISLLAVPLGRLEDLEDEDEE